MRIVERGTLRADFERGCDVYEVVGVGSGVNGKSVAILGIWVFFTLGNWINIRIL